MPDINEFQYCNIVYHIRTKAAEVQQKMPWSNCNWGILYNLLLILGAYCILTTIRRRQVNTKFKSKLLCNILNYRLIKRCWVAVSSILPIRIRHLHIFEKVCQEQGFTPTTFRFSYREQSDLWQDAKNPISSDWKISLFLLRLASNLYCLSKAAFRCSLISCYSPSYDICHSFDLSIPFRIFLFIQSFYVCTSPSMSSGLLGYFLRAFLLSETK